MARNGAQLYHHYPQEIHRSLQPSSTETIQNKKEKTQKKEESLVEKLELLP